MHAAGTSWMQEIVWQIHSVAGVGRLPEGNLDIRVPFLEVPHTELLTEEDIVNRPSPRFIKTHLPYFALPNDAIAGKCRVCGLLLSRFTLQPNLIDLTHSEFQAYTRPHWFYNPQRRRIQTCLTNGSRTKVRGFSRAAARIGC